MDTYSNRSLCGAEVAASAPPVRTVERRQRFVPLALAAAVGLLTACHVYYVRNSGMVPSADEAHYMSGALSIASGIRTGTLAGAWHGYLTALVFKAPLVCVPAALFMLFGGLEFPCLLSLCATFAALGYVSYRLFRKCVEPAIAAAATILLLTTPLVTGLTHRFYVELLLLLVSIVYLAVLTRGPWTSWRWSAAAGVLMGLGLLTKFTFVGILALPTVWSLAMAVLPGEGMRRRVPAVLKRLALALGVGIAVAGPWYRTNLGSVLQHSQLAASTADCYFPNWITADLSSGPGVLLSLLALVGLAMLARALYRRQVQRPEGNVWILILLLAISTALAVAATLNKATRFQITGLPAFALLAAAGPGYVFPRRMKLAALAALALAGITLSLHISFNLLPWGPVRLGELRLLDSRFPLNIPGWYEDNHPLDRRVVPIAKVVPCIAQDAAARLRNGEKIRVRTIEMGLLINHDYLDLLAMARGENVYYVWWPGATPTGAGAPDYIVHTRGFHALYPGIHFFEYYPSFEADVASGRVPYQLIDRFEGPAGSAVLVYRKIQ